MKLSPPVALTLGVFDGVHLGHQALLKAMREIVGLSGSIVVVTFRNHPQEVIHKKTIRLITTVPERLKLLKAAGADLVLMLEFTSDVAKLSYDTFLKDLHIPFQHLVLGKGAAFGFKTEGDEAHIKKLSSTQHFKAHYLPKLEIDGAPVSAGRIRTLIADGDTAAAERLLGRPSTK